MSQQMEKVKVGLTALKGSLMMSSLEAFPYLQILGDAVEQREVLRGLAGACAVRSSPKRTSKAQSSLFTMLQY